MPAPISISSDFKVFDFTYKFSPRFVDFAKKSGMAINPDVIAEFLASAVGEATQTAINNAPEDTGFLKRNIHFYMPSKVTAILAAEADYSAAQEFGYRDKSGRWQTGKHFIMPAATTAKKRIAENIRFLEQAFIKGIKPTFKSSPISPKTGFPSVAKKPSRTGFGRQTTARMRTRPVDFSGVIHVSRKKVQRFGTFKRGQGRRLIGGAK